MKKEVIITCFLGILFSILWVYSPSSIKQYFLKSDAVSQTCTSASKDGVTWTWTPARPCGIYANGDWWVVGPITITSITPIPVKYPASADGTIIVDNGSMLNPTIGTNHGFTSRGTYNIKKTNSESFYKDALNVGLRLPLSIPTNSSLVSSITNTNWNYPITSFSILTIVDSIPADGSFRPAPYGSGSRASLWQESQLNYTKLANYPKKNLSIPDIASLTSDFSHSWFEIDINWTGGYLRTPYMSEKGYGQWLAQKTADAGLLLNLDYTNAQKRNLLVGFVQAGIDNYGFIQKGGVWYNDGGHNLGRLNPVMVAATVLGDDTIKSVLKGSSLKFQEFQNTFFISQVDVNRRTQKTYNGVNGDVNIPYVSSDIGTAEWGVRHADIPTLDNRWTAASYRAINGSTFLGTTLLAQVLGLENYINHPALFQYARRHLDMENQGVCLETGLKDETTNCVAYNRIPSFHKQFYVLYNGGTLPPLPPGNNNGDTGNNIETPSIPLPFDINNTVSTTNIINVRSTAALGGQTNLLGPQNQGQTGKIIDGPIIADGITWWYIDYASGVDGWSGQDNLSVSTIVTTPVYGLTLSNTPGGHLSTTRVSLTKIPENITVKVTAVPSDGYRITGWTGCTTSNDTVCEVTMTNNKTVQAQFEEIPVARVCRPWN